MTTQKPSSLRAGAADGELESGSRRRSVIKVARRSLAVAYDKTRRGLETAVDYGSQHPGGMSLVALGAGLGIGILVARGRNRRSAVVAAVADAIGTFARHFAR